MNKILIIEDDIAIAEIERDYLEINGFEVKIETDGASGMNTALKGGFQLILLDLMLPEVDGFTVCRSLREHLDIPILMVTAKKEDIDKIRGLGLGADDYIVKPFSPGELVARVQAHIATYNRLKGGTQEIQPEITVGAIRINPKSHRVFVKEKEISLKNKEYELLLFLVTNADMVFDKETLYERIWGMDAVGDNATVAVHINRLREKIEDDPSRPHYIETVWGAGYRFRCS
ncbi:MAG: response regulator transcription factor [Oscillospiraceae bacterium]|nr:response regulator transcription factor [Oscillospiraceae bacterium]